MRTLFRRSPALAALAVCLLAAQARAGGIGLRIEPSVTLTGQTAAVAVTLRSTGSEAARRVRMSLARGDYATPVIDAGDIPVGGAITLETALPAPDTRGTFPAVARVDYVDARGYAASAVKAFTIAAGTPPPVPEMVVRLGDAQLEPTGMQELRLYPHFRGERSVQVRLVYPSDLACDNPVKTVSLREGAPRRVRFALRNVTGRRGSRYRIYAVVTGSATGVAWCEVADARAEIPGYRNLLTRHQSWTWLAAALCMLVFAALQFLPVPAHAAASPPRGRESPGIVGWITSGGALLVWLWFFFDHIPLSLLLRDTTLAGGDTIAHNYLASRLATALFEEGRIIAWAPGWWCGFPMFQYYFCLPYVIAALLDLVLPFDLALKLVTVLGVLALPVCAFVGARAMRLRWPGPLLVGIAAVVFLFDRSHTMWGVNVYSTLAGMIANSLSFALMLLAVGAATVDADRGRCRVRTVVLFTLLAASHFFTTLMAACVIALLPFLRPRAGVRRALTVLACDAVWAFLLMAWWLIPLSAKREFAVDYGVNWNVDLMQRLPDAAFVAVPFALIAVVTCRRTGARFVLALLWMAAVAGTLFRFGYALSPVFVNVRLWPFLTFSLLALGAAGLARLLQAARRGTPWAIAAILLVAFSAGIDRPNHVRDWAEWNYSGLEDKPRYPVIERLVLPLEGTPGRLANDLHDDNNALGSSRVFEVVPHLIGKPVLEGGIVNSAVGAFYSYYIQSLTSGRAAGHPPIVEPGAFDMAHATRLLELFNVSHFIAHGDTTRRALAERPEWTRLAQEDAWELFALNTHDSRYVSVCNDPAVVVPGADWKQLSLDWLYDARRLRQPVVFLRDGQPPPPHAAPPRADLPDPPAAAVTDMPGRPLGADFTPIRTETVTAHRIRFTTGAVGRPHLVRCTYFPNWKVRGAAAVYMVSPCFMLVYPEQTEVELYYGRTFADTAGQGLTLIGLILLAALPVRRVRRQKEARGNGDVVES